MSIVDTVKDIELPQRLQRLVVPMYWNANRKNGAMDYTLGDAVIYGGLYQNNLGILFVPPSFRSDMFKYIENIGGLTIFSYDSDSNPVSDMQRAFPTEEKRGLAVTPLTNALGKSFRYPNIVQKVAGKSSEFDTVYNFDASPELQLNANNIERWKALNPTAKDVGGYSMSLANTIARMQEATFYVGALNGMAHLAMACGLQVTAYVPDRAVLSQKKSVTRKILRTAGASIDNESTWMVNAAIDLPENF